MGVSVALTLSGLCALGPQYTMASPRSSHNSGSLAFTAIHSHHKVGLKVREWPQSEIEKYKLRDRREVGMNQLAACLAQAGIHMLSSRVGWLLQEQPHMLRLPFPWLCSSLCPEQGQDFQGFKGTITIDRET